MKVLIVEDQFIEAYDLQLMLERNGYIVTGIASSAREALTLIEKHPPDLICLDIFIKGEDTGIDLGKKILGTGIAIVYISANSGKSILDQAKVTNPYGFIVKPFREQDIISTLEIASYRHRHQAVQYTENKNLLQQQMDLLTSGLLTKTDFLVRFGTMIQSFVPFDYLELRLYAGHDITGLLRKNFREYKLLESAQLSALNPTTYKDLDPDKEKYSFNEPAICEGQDFVVACKVSGSCRFSAEVFGVRSFLVVPFSVHGTPAAIFFYNRQSQTYNQGHLALLPEILPGVIQVLENTSGSKPAKVATGKLPSQKADTITNPGFEGMVGSNKKMLAVYDAASRVAASDTSVLVLGENGTGKEHVARCIHKLSDRKDKPFIAVNCAAIPHNLAESILFGHEKGAFTGATERHIGKFEQAENGTIFLDEIGEMPIELQVKLLRVLQENEIERVGGQKTVKINARIIAATNKDLEEEVTTGRFRMDLFYRLYVFPITVPALRERAEDIPELARYFISSYCKKLKKQPMELSHAALDQLVRYSWPGNVRQLEHAIQRAMIMTDNGIIDEVPLPGAAPVAGHALPLEFSIDSVKTIQEMERDYIYHILKKCRGKVYGSGGAAELLNLPPSTLNSRMKKLGISLKT